MGIRLIYFSEIHYIIVKVICRRCNCVLSIRAVRHRLFSDNGHESGRFGWRLRSLTNRIQTFQSFLFGGESFLQKNEWILKEVEFLNKFSHTCSTLCSLVDDSFQQGSYFKIWKVIFPGFISDISKWYTSIHHCMRSI